MKVKRGERKPIAGGAVIVSFCTPERFRSLVKLDDDDDVSPRRLCHINCRAAKRDDKVTAIHAYFAG